MDGDPRLPADIERFFARRTGQPTDAEDLTQETLVRALAKKDQVRDPDAVRSWMFAIARNLLRDRHRAADRDPLPVDAAEILPAPSVPPEWSARVRQAIRDALASLPEGQRHVILLRVFHDLPFAAIAHRLGVPEATAWTRAFHGIRRLRAAVAARLRQEGLVMECAEARGRMLRVAFGAPPHRLEEEVRRHLAGCPECRREFEVVRAMQDGVAVTATAGMMVAGWTLRDASGAATSYWLETAVNDSAGVRDEWGCNSARPAEEWAWFDPEGRRLELARQQRHPDGWRWAMRFRLPEPWHPGETVRMIGVLPVHMHVSHALRRHTVRWSELPLSPGPGGPREVVCRRALQLPPGYRAVRCEPEPDLRVHDALLTWSMVVPKGDHLNLRVEFVEAAAPNAR